MIPKIIHYCWFGNKEIPLKIKKYINSWKEICPDYKIIEWNEKNFDININKYVKEAYDAKKWAFVADFARLWIVYNYGGIYLDTDVEVIKRFDEMLSKKAFFGLEKSDKYYVNTGLGFGAEKENSIIYEMIKQYENIAFILEDNSYDMLPCPIRNSKVFENYGFKYKNEMLDTKEFVIFPTEYFCPIDFATKDMKITDNTISIHHYLGSWEKKTTKIKSTIYRILLKYRKK